MDQMSFQDRIPRISSAAHTLSPIILLISFLIAFLVHSLSSAKCYYYQSSTPGQTEPGAKSLPRRPSPCRSESSARLLVLPDFSPSARLTFRWLNVLLLITYVIDAASTVSHAIISRDQHWWCGQSLVVCPKFSENVYA